MFTVNYAGYNVEEKRDARVLRPDGSGDYTLIFFLTNMHVILDDEIQEAWPGSCVLFRPTDIQDYNSVHDFRYSFVHFSAPKEEIEKYGVPFFTVFTPKDPNYVNDTLREIQEEYFTLNSFSEDVMDGLLKSLFASLSRERIAEEMDLEAGRPLYNLFCQARYTILSNCDKEWASTNMCQMVSLSRSQFYKYYNDFFGVSPMADLAAARIEKAKFLLTNKSLQVTEIATLCGYASIHHFSRTFKEHCGMSPLAYAKEVAERGTI